MNKEEKSAYNAAYYQEKREELLAYKAERAREKPEVLRETRRKSDTKRDKKKRTAQNAVNSAVRAGRLLPAPALDCTLRHEGCEGQAANWHHHSGYEEDCWFAIQSVCKPCHEAEHRGLK